MTITLDLTPEEETRLRELAAAKGIVPADAIRLALPYLWAMAADEDDEDDEDNVVMGDGKPTEEELDALFEEMAADGDDQPIFSIEDTSREAIYADHD